MAIKIDLLPGYVGLTKWFRRVVTLSVVALGLLTGALLLVYHSKQLELKTAEQNRDVVKDIAAKTTAADTATTTANTERAGYDAANSFMLTSSKTGAERAALVNLITKYIYENSVVKSIDVSDGKNVTIVATVTTPDEYLAFLSRLRKATGVLFASDAKLSGVGGFANGATPLVVPQPDPGSNAVVVNYPITLTATAPLLNPIQVPADPTTGATTTTGASGTPNGPGAPVSPAAAPAPVPAKP